MSINSNVFKTTKVCGEFRNSDYPDSSKLAKGLFDRDVEIKGNLILGNETSVTTTSPTGEVITTYTDTNGQIQFKMNGMLMIITRQQLAQLLFPLATTVALTAGLDAKVDTTVLNEVLHNYLTETQITTSYFNKTAINSMFTAQAIINDTITQNKINQDNKNTAQATVNSNQLSVNAAQSAVNSNQILVNTAQGTINSSQATTNALKAPLSAPAFSNYAYYNNINGVYPDTTAPKFLALGSNLSGGQGEGDFVNTYVGQQTTTVMAFLFAKLLTTSTKKDLLKIFNSGDATLLGTLTLSDLVTVGPNPISSLNTIIAAMKADAVTVAGLIATNKAAQDTIGTSLSTLSTTVTNNKTAQNTIRADVDSLALVVESNKLDQDTLGLTVTANREDLTNYVTSFNSSISTLDTKIMNNKTAQDTIGTSLSTLSTTVTNNKTAQNTIRADVDSLALVVESNKLDQDTLGLTVTANRDDLTNYVQSFNSSISTLDTKITNNKTAQDSIAASLSALSTTVTNNKASQDTSGTSLSTLSTTVTNNKTAQDAIGTSLSTLSTTVTNNKTTQDSTNAAQSAVNANQILVNNAQGTINSAQATTNALKAPLIAPAFSSYAYFNNINGSYPDAVAPKFLALGSNLFGGQGEGVFMNTYTALQTATSLAFLFSKQITANPSPTRRDLFKLFNTGDAGLLGKLTLTDLSTTGTNPITSLNDTVAAKVNTSTFTISLATKQDSLSAIILGYLNALTSDPQTQINGKQPTISSTLLGYLGGFTSDPQTQINGKQATISSTMLGYLGGFTSDPQTQINGKQPTIASTLLGYLASFTSNPQDQINGKQPLLNGTILTNAFKMVADGTTWKIWNNAVTNTLTGFALFQGQAGDTVINSAASQQLQLKIANEIGAVLDADRNFTVSRNLNVVENITGPTITNIYDTIGDIYKTQRYSPFVAKFLFIPARPTFDNAIYGQNFVYNTYMNSDLFCSMYSCEYPFGANGNIPSFIVVSPFYEVLMYSGVNFTGQEQYCTVFSGTFPKMFKINGNPKSIRIYKILSTQQFLGATVIGAKQELWVTGMSDVNYPT